MSKESIQRHQIADYINIGGATGTEKYELMGAGFNTLDENPAAQLDTKVYINDKSSSTTIKSYQTQFPFTSDLIKSEGAVMALYNVGRNHLTGSDAQFDYVKVELFQPIDGSENTYKARKFKVSCEVAALAGAGGETIVVSGNLNAVGDFIEGTFNTTTKTFTAV
ncbi:hypothetical protein GCM10008908_05880 [Clostridium subterminale]|uniref:Phage tail protein n=1 Tax=Clostridium subterminale TaxID=1550 RepID=A0ABP3VR41_CLOSU